DSLGVLQRTKTRRTLRLLSFACATGFPTDCALSGIPESGSDHSAVGIQSAAWLQTVRQGASRGDWRPLAPALLGRSQIFEHQADPPKTELLQPHPKRSGGNHH